jgi:predicted nicotinamide N-methyase
MNPQLEKRCRTYNFSDGDKDVVLITVQEVRRMCRVRLCLTATSLATNNKSPLRVTTWHQQVVSSEFGLFLWPSAHVLAKYLWAGREGLIRGKSVIELGAGCGLPGLLCARAGATRVVLTDR